VGDELYQWSNGLLIARRESLGPKLTRGDTTESAELTNAKERHNFLVTLRKQIIAIGNNVDFSTIQPLTNVQNHSFKHSGAVIADPNLEVCDAVVAHDQDKMRDGVGVA
jgi:hypothetical protein